MKREPLFKVEPKNELNGRVFYLTPKGSRAHLVANETVLLTAEVLTKTFCGLNVTLDSIQSGGALSKEHDKKVCQTCIAVDNNLEKEYYGAKKR